MCDGFDFLIGHLGRDLIHHGVLPGMDLVCLETLAEGFKLQDDIRSMLASQPRELGGFVAAAARAVAGNAGGDAALKDAAAIDQFT